MKKSLLLSLGILCIGALSMNSAFAQQDDLVGFYKGSPDKSAKPNMGYPLNMYKDLYVQIYRLRDKYTLRVLSGILSRAETASIAEDLSAKNGKIEFATKGDFSIKGIVENGEIKSIGISRDKKEVKFDLKKYNVEPENMGMKPPEGAVVLFDGTNGDKNWTLKDKNKSPFNWKVKGDVMTVPNIKIDGKRIPSTIVSKQSFGKSHLHLEFNIPPMYNSFAQGRANSGVFVGPYEVQILDSFGVEGTWDSCGSIYRQTPSIFNASLEPGAWQVYDIYFTPAEFDGDKVKSLPLMTVYHNGKRIQNETPVKPTSGGGNKKNHPKGDLQITLQDHGNPISFRNVWIKED